jgi:hypothetical protein
MAFRLKLAVRGTGSDKALAVKAGISLNEVAAKVVDQFVEDFVAFKSGGVAGDSDGFSDCDKVFLAHVIFPVPPGLYCSDW